MRPGTPRGHETILVVEDDALVQGYVIAQLGSLGYRTLVASDGVAALALVDQGVAFDLLFTDMIMPGGMNGRELAEAVRQAPRRDQGALHLGLYRQRHRARRPPRSRRRPAQKAVPEIGSGAENPRGVGKRVAVAIAVFSIQEAFQRGARREKRGGMDPPRPICCLAGPGLRAPRCQAFFRA